MSFPLLPFFFFFNDTATTEIYTLSLHDALPICRVEDRELALLRHLERAAVVTKLQRAHAWLGEPALLAPDGRGDRKSTRLNSSHTVISYAVFCLKKKKKKNDQKQRPKTKSMWPA